MEQCMNGGPSSHTSIVHYKCLFTVKARLGLSGSLETCIFVDNRNTTYIPIGLYTKWLPRNKMMFQLLVHLHTSECILTHENSQEPYLHKRKT